MRSIVPWGFEELAAREKVFDGLIEKAVKMSLRPLAANVDGLLTAAAAELGLSDLASSMLGPTVSMDSAGRLEVSWQHYANKEIVPYLEATMEEGAERVRRELASDIVALDRSIMVDYLESAKSRIVGLSNFVWLAVRSQLTQGVEAGENMQQLSRRVRAALQDTSVRAMSIARTEIHRAAMAGAYQQMKLAGFSDEQCRKKWRTEEDERVRLAHVIADNQTVGLSQLFEVGGEYLEFPGDPNGRADNVINCRCDVEYQILEDVTISAGGWASPSSVNWHVFHLPDKHDQRSHGNREGRVKVATKRYPTVSNGNPPTDPEEEARSEMARITSARSHAKVLADLEEALLNDMSSEGAQLALTPRLRAEGLEDTSIGKEVIAAARTGDKAALNRLIERLSKQHRLTRIGGKVADPDQMVKYDKTLHDTGGDPPVETGMVVVTKPGYKTETAKGTAVLFKALAASLSPEEVASIREGGGWGQDTLRASGWHVFEWTAEDEEKHPRGAGGRFKKKGEAVPSVPAIAPIPQFLTPNVPLKDILPQVTKDTKNPPEIPFDNVRQLKEIFRGEFLGGFSTAVKSVEWAKGSARISVEGVVRNKKGNDVGVFERVFKIKKDGTYAVEHSLLALDSDVQGQGFAHQFNKRAFAGYKRMGVAQVELQADIDVGGYAWARAGYDWLNDDVPSLAEMLNRIEDARNPQLKEPPERTQKQKEDGHWPLAHNLWRIPAEKREEQARLVQNLLFDIGKTVDMDTPDDELAEIIEMWPTPYELANLGRWDGAGKDDWWIGKAIMMGSNWMGVKYLEDDNAIS